MFEHLLPRTPCGAELDGYQPPQIFSQGERYLCGAPLVVVFIKDLARSSLLDDLVHFRPQIDTEFLHSLFCPQTDVARILIETF